MSYPCHCCSYIARTSSDLGSHITISHRHLFLYNQHQYPSPFQPSTSSSTSSSLTPIRPPDESKKPKIQAKYSCDSCGNLFRHKGNLQRHVNTIHKKGTEYSCDSCPYKTIHKHFLNNHKQRVHQQIKRFSCDHCDYQTFDSGNLERHCKMVHLQLKSRFSCDHCAYQTYLQANLNRHVKTVHLKMKNYECHLCDHKSASSQTLRIHINNKHSNNPETFACHCCGKNSKPSII